MLAHGSAVIMATIRDDDFAILEHPPYLLGQGTRGKLNRFSQQKFHHKELPARGRPWGLLKRALEFAALTVP
ncbi:hypothetical protein EVAR_22080_1 [Eumeta japonica]|uniref:Uncharacterized protein n=1 Tax=Eumeta variegata TaxID=151549 RepID=A0A4C1USP5_EUMVA|nr:hypothetical protein EVAR_22080_1 [Eumeta japonica]